MAKLLSYVLASSLVLTGPAFAADEHEHHHSPKAQNTAVKPEPGKKFESDKPLRQHMGEIRTELQSKMGAVHEGKLKPEDYKSLSVKIDSSIGSIFKECKLKADADAALHVILAEMMAGSAAMKNGSSNGERAKGFLKIAKALESYAETFKDSTWKPLKI